jgi:FlaG/FlaF family flagellin (archaellin)
MVAITVILAAVIAAFVFGMASGVQKTKTVAVTARQMGNYLYLTYQGGQDDAMVSNLSVQFLDNGTVFAYDASAASTGHLALTPPGTPANAKPVVGASMTSYGGTPSSDHVVSTIQFTDGSVQVVLDTYV